MQPKRSDPNEKPVRATYFREMVSLACQTRACYSDECLKLGLNAVRAIYKKEGIEIDYRDIKSPRIRAMYIYDEDGCTVMVKKSLPREPKLFSLLHELKHHLSDRDIIASGKLICGDYNENQVIEIGAEVFAAEF